MEGDGRPDMQSNLRLLYVLMYEQDALDQLRDKYRFAPLLVNIDTVWGAPLSFE